MSRTRVQQRIAIGAFAMLVVVAIVAMSLGAGTPPAARADGASTPADIPLATPMSAAASDRAEVGGSAELRTFAAPDGSFSITLPGSWHRSTQPPNATTLYLVDGHVEMSIRTANDEGSITTCDEPAGPWETCVTDRPRSLDVLAELIGLTNEAEQGMTPRGPIRTEMVLDGEAANVELIEAHEYPAKGLEFVKYVVAMHEGRPFIVRIWTSWGDGIDPASELLSGFRFSDAAEAASPDDPAPTAGATAESWFSSPDQTFAIRLPDGWHLTQGLDPTALYVSSPLAKVSISIRGAAADGSIRTCDVAGASWESCTLARPETLDDLAEAVALDRDSPDLMVGPNTTDVILGGVPARSIAASGLGGRPLISIRYVVALRDGRAFVVRAKGRGGEIQPHLGLMPLLEGFEFR